MYGFDWAAAHCRTLERDASKGERERLAAMIVSLRDHLDAHTIARPGGDVQSQR